MSDEGEAYFLARNERYLVEIVEAFDVCPYARSTRNNGQLAREVLLGAPSVEEVAARARAHEHGGAPIVLLILPDFAGDATAFERHVDAVRRAERVSTTFAMAPFHPLTSYATDTPSRLVGLFRRSPDPTIQLVRYSALEAVKKRAPDGKFFFDGSAASWAAIAARPERGVSEQITYANFERLRERAADLEAKLASLRSQGGSASPPSKRVPR